ncbi:hypothetical protein GCM10011384_11780 [Psychrobacillus lasiicapitis]|nr:hypothetical protein GCM10011384_11780 [Psychrobacillus lasiicapitis]
MIGSPEINKVIRKILTPILKENGFNKVKRGIIGHTSIIVSGY